MPDTKNETLALLMGYEWRVTTPFTNGRFLARPGMRLFDHGAEAATGDERVWHPYENAVPDYTDWARFPDLQEYVQDLEIMAQSEVISKVDAATGELAYRPWMYITPTILRDAIVEVMG